MIAFPVVAHGNPGATCYSSPMGFYDSFFNAQKRNEEVVGIARIALHGATVGWLYKTSDNRYYVQSMPNMPLHDQEKLGFPQPNYDPSFKPPSGHGRPMRYSGLVEIHRWPPTALNTSNSCSR